MQRRSRLAAVIRLAELAERRAVAVLARAAARAEQCTRAQQALEDSLRAAGAVPARGAPALELAQAARHRTQLQRELAGAGSASAQAARAQEDARAQAAAARLRLRGLRKVERVRAERALREQRVRVERRREALERALGEELHRAGE